MKTEKEKIELLIKANERLTNQYKNLTSDIDRLKDIVKKIGDWIDDIEKRLDGHPKKMVVGNTYIKEIESIIEAKEVEWKGSDWINYTILLEGHEEAFEVFTLADTCLQPGRTIQFILSEGSKLKNLKLKNW